MTGTARSSSEASPTAASAHEPIDYTLPYLDPGEYVVDHIVPLAKGGADTSENKQAAHRSCNRTKGDKSADELGPRRYVTWREW